MANPLTQEPGVSTPLLGSPIESGLADVTWGTAILGSQFSETVAGTSGYLQLVAVALNDTATNLGVTSGFQDITNGALYVRPQYECHLFVQSHFFFLATAGAMAPTSTLTVRIQLWLNGYFPFISPSGWGNDWTIQIPPVAANQSSQFSQTFHAWVFNLAFAAAPSAHVLKYRYTMSSIDANWAVAQVKPRMMMAEAFPSTQLTFVNQVATSA